VNDRLLIVEGSHDGAPSIADLRRPRPEVATWLEMWRDLDAAATALRDGHGERLENLHAHDVSTHSIDGIRIVHWQIGGDFGSRRLERTLVASSSRGEIILSTRPPMSARLHPDVDDRTAETEVAFMARTGLMAMSALCGVDGMTTASPDDVDLLHRAASRASRLVPTGRDRFDERSGRFVHRSPLNGPLVSSETGRTVECPSVLDAMPMAITAGLAGVGHPDRPKCPRLIVRPLESHCESGTDDPVALLRAESDLRRVLEERMPSSIEWTLA